MCGVKVNEMVDSMYIWQVVGIIILNSTLHYLTWFGNMWYQGERDSLVVNWQVVGIILMSDK